MADKQRARCGERRKIMFDTMKIAKKIREARMAKNLTQMNLADALGVSYQAVSNWERGNSMPDISKLEDLCNALDISVNELLGMENRTATAVEKAMQKESLTMEELAEVAPILPPEEVKEQAKKSGTTYNIAALSEIAPFLEASVLEEILGETEVESLSQLSCIAPFLSTQLLDKLVRQAPGGDFDGICAMAPFLSDSTLDYLVERCQDRPEDLACLHALAPFLSERALDQLVQKYDNDLDEEMLKSLVPFLSDSSMDRLVEGRLAQGKTEGLFQLYPFMSQKTLKKLAKVLMESGNLDEIKKAVMFL